MCDLFLEHKYSNITMNMKYFFKVSVSTDKRSYSPGDNVHFTVNSARHSVVYLLTIDEGIQYSHSGFDLDMQDVSF